MRCLKKRRIDPEIAPDEIFLDASNSPEFVDRFEGRIEQPLARSTFSLIGITLAMLLVGFSARAWDIQGMHGAEYAERSAINSLDVTTVFAPRGIITDRIGEPLVENTLLPDGRVERHYLYDSTSHVIGYVSYPKKDTSGVYYDTITHGVAGLEARYDDLLAGENGKMLVETDALGEERSSGIIYPSREGDSLALTLDISLQEPLYQAIQSIATDKGFIAGAGVILNVATGETLALVSYPSYDSNVMATGAPRDTIAEYTTDPGHPFIDHAIQGVYAPGSIVKPFVAAGALQDNIITPDTIINDKGRIFLPNPYHPGEGYTFTGWRALGPVDVENAIAWSSDIFFYTIGGGFDEQAGLGIERLAYWYRQFGIGEITGIDLPSEEPGLVPTPAWKSALLGEPWYLGDTYFTAIGQYSMQVTPIQMARATAALVNGGTVLTPVIVNGEHSAYTSVPVSPKTLEPVREGMRLAVTSALAGALNLPYVSVAAKTGTAQTGTHNQYDNSWVEGFFPYEHPRYAFAVVLERGPEGAGSQAVNVMRAFFNALHAADSPYVGGTTATTTTTINN